MSTFVNQTFDDSDRTHLKYEGDWFLGGFYNASNVGQTGTLSYTNDLNANVTFAFPIPAIAFYYYGIPRCCGALYGICIDCDPLNPNFLPINAVNRSDDGKNPPIVLYSMQFKDPGIHEIIIRNENDTSVDPSGKSELTIDRIDLEVVADTVTSVTTSSDLSTTVITSIASGVLASSSSVSTPPPSQSSSSHSPSIGAIVGGVLGGGFVLVLVLLLLFWFRLVKQKQKVSTENSGPSPFVTPPQQTSSFHPGPLLLSSNSTTATSPTQNSTITTIPSTNEQDPGRYGCAPRTGKGMQSYYYSPSPLPSSSSQPNSTAQVLQREHDAGPLPTELESPISPPEYSQVFSHTIHSS